MRLSIQNAILALLPAGALAHNIALGPYSRECFYETLRRNDQMTVTFQVGDREFGSSGAMEVDFWIQEPTGSNYLHERAVSSGDHGFESRHDGRHTYCFSNEHSSASSKEVSFNVHGTVFVSEGESKEPLDVEVKNLSNLLNQVRDEQQYIVIRERTHRNTAESTNARVKWWSIAQMGVLVGEGVFQVWWLKRFFEVKRVV